ncbi:hypothetical protein EDB84DRAFT_1447112 [Lactarius hengduanensis]|nr:hypothetical protein EDB84DRAFT_1447112 [Lactarius hengduanensis]
MMRMPAAVLLAVQVVVAEAELLLLSSWLGSLQALRWRVPGGGWCPKPNNRPTGNRRRRPTNASPPTTQVQPRLPQMQRQRHPTMTPAAGTTARQRQLNHDDNRVKDNDNGTRGNIERTSPTHKLACIGNDNNSTHNNDATDDAADDGNDATIAGGSDDSLYRSVTILVF